MQIDSDVCSDLQDKISQVNINGWSHINRRHAKLGKETLTIDRFNVMKFKLNILFVVYHVGENIAEKVSREYLIKDYDSIG